MRLDGQRVGQYRLIHLLRAGGMGEVYLADDEYLNRRVAIKIIWTDISHYPNPAEAAEAARLFVREAQAVAQLDHMHILPVYDSGEDDVEGISFMYMVMPFRATGSLADWLDSHEDSPPLSLWEVERIVRQAANALQYAHNHQIIHQDVKPSNFLIHGDTERADQLILQLADFGASRFMTTTSQSQIIRGTPTYMAPELWDGHPVAATDQYALAVMAYELLTGQPPFDAENQQQLWYQHAHHIPLAPSTINPAIPVALDAVLLRALAKEPQDRFPSISGFAQAFRGALAGKSVALSKPSLVERVRPLVEEVPLPRNDTKPVVHQKRRPKGRNFLLFGVALLLIAGGILAVGYSTWTNVQSSQRANATATANAASANNANSNSTASARESLTSIAQTNAASTTQTNTTATVQANTTATQIANASATAQANASATSEANAAATQQAYANATQQAYANASATAQAVLALYQTAIAGTLAVDDPLQDNSSSYGWDSQYAPGYGGCTFSQGTYHAIVQQGSFYACLAQNTAFTDFAFEAHMKIISGNQGGIAFRAAGDSGAFYYFQINTNGSFALDIYNNNLFVKTIATGTSSAIKTGLNQTNVLTVVALNNTLTLFVNMHQVAVVIDTTFSSGEIGVVAENTGASADIAFSDVRVWTK